MAATIRYRSDDLRSLRESPLVAKPHELPDIHQWIEQPNERNKQRKNEDGDENHKRPNLAQTRNRPSQSGDMFLGPKMSFAAASANRKEGERSISEELKEKIAGTARDTIFRDRERNNNRREPREHLNEHSEDGQRKGAGRRGSGGEGDRPRLKLNRQRQTDGVVDEELPTPRRAGLPEKLNKPWFRDTNEQDRHNVFGDRDLRSPLKEHWGKESRHEHKPSWMGEPPAVEDEAVPGSQKEFEAWKEMMNKKKQGDQDPVIKTPMREEFGNGTMLDGSNEPLNSPTQVQPLFGTWGQSLDEDKKVEEPKKPAKPVKASRFFPGVAPKQQEPDVAKVEPLKDSPAPVSPQVDEDKQGFQRVMAMLHEKGSISRGQTESAFSPPPLQAPQQPNNSTPSSNVPPPMSGHPAHSPHEVPASPPAHLQSPPSAQHRQPPLDRNAEFLMNLMKNPQPRAPFQEGQIYGQNYNQRREPDDIASIINVVSPYPMKNPRPPPGFYDNQNTFDHNNNIDDSGRAPPPRKVPEDDFVQLNIRPNEQHRGQTLPDFNFPPRPPDYGPPPPGPHQRPPSGEGIGPPPGFGMRPIVPPGFSMYGPGQNGPPNQQPPPQMRVPPMQFNGHPPPGFGPGPPPGIGPQHGGRRMPSGNVPPNFEMYGDFQRRQGGPMPPPQSTYGQYIKQGGGPGAYQGM